MILRDLEIAPPREKPPASLPITTDLFFDPKSPAHIPIHSNVLVVGPGIDRYCYAREIPMDRSLVVLPEYLKNGSITVFDVPDECDTRYGSHSLRSIRSWFNFLGLCSERPICPLIIREGYVLQATTSHFNATFDIIHDHLTTDDWLIDPLSNTRFQRLENARKIAALYALILKTGGKVIVHLKKNNHSSDILVAAFEEIGMIAKLICPVRDVYDILHIFLLSSDKKSFGREY